MKLQQALNTLIALPIANLIAELIDADMASQLTALFGPFLQSFGFSGAPSANHLELVLTLVIAAGVISPLIEAGRAVLLDLIPAGRLPRLYKLLGGTLLAFALASCASTKSIPTSSDASVTDEGATAKGGTIVCAGAMTATLDPATGNVTSLTCASKGAWTDPPTESETTALSKFGDSLVGIARVPLDLLATIGTALAAPASAPR